MWLSHVSAPVAHEHFMQLCEAQFISASTPKGLSNSNSHGGSCGGWLVKLGQLVQTAPWAQSMQTALVAHVVARQLEWLSAGTVYFQHALLVHSSHLQA